jgi:hypothetical protein
MGPYRELFVDAEDAIANERYQSVYADWAPIIAGLYPPGPSTALELARRLDIEERVIAYCEGRIVRQRPLLNLVGGLTLGLSDLL